MTRNYTSSTQSSAGRPRGHTSSTHTSSGYRPSERNVRGGSTRLNSVDLSDSDHIPSQDARGDYPPFPNHNQRITGHQRRGNDTVYEIDEFDDNPPRTDCSGRGDSSFGRGGRSHGMSSDWHPRTRALDSDDDDIIPVHSDDEIIAFRESTFDGTSEEENEAVGREIRRQRALSHRARGSRHGHSDDSSDSDVSPHTSSRHTASRSTRSGRDDRDLTRYNELIREGTRRGAVDHGRSDHGRSSRY